MSRLLIAGVVAGPLFILTVVGQAVTRDGFDLRRHPLSLLAVGEHGWIQGTVFVVTGVLLIMAAVGLRPTVPPGRGKRLGLWSVALMGVGMIIAGVFPTDAGAGFPVGAPEGAPVISWHGIVHEVGFGLTVLGWVAASVVFARRFVVGRRPVWAGACVGTLVAGLVVAGWPHLDSLSPRLVVASAIQLGFVAVLSARGLRSTLDATHRLL